MSAMLMDYRIKLIRSLIFQHAENFAAEDQLLAELDRIWLTLPTAERLEADAFAAEIARKQPTIQALQFLQLELMSAGNQTATSSTSADVAIPTDARVIRTFQPIRICENSQRRIDLVGLIIRSTLGIGGVPEQRRGSTPNSEWCFV